MYPNQKIEDITECIFAPVDNLLGTFNTYVYCKESFDPAPRLVQECKFFNKNMIYARSLDLIDGGLVYWKRRVKPPCVKPILDSLDYLEHYD